MIGSSSQMPNPSPWIKGNITACHLESDINLQDRNQLDTVPFTKFTEQ
jgi:hypothetical protein